MTLSRSSHDTPDPKHILEEEFESEILDILDSSLDKERKNSHTHGSERLEDSLSNEDTLCTSKESLPNEPSPGRANDDVLSDALYNPEESPRLGVINNDKKHQSTPGEVLNDHLHHDLSADPALPVSSKDEISGSCSGPPSRFILDPLPVTAELSDNVEMDMESSASIDPSEGKASEGVRIDGDVNDDAEGIEEDKVLNTDTAADSEEAFNSVSTDHEAMLSDSTSDEDSDMDSDSEGEVLGAEDNYESDDDAYNLSNGYLDLSDTDDSSDGEMLYVNEAELSDPGHASSSEEVYDSDTSSDEEGLEEKPPADAGGDVWNGEKSDSEAVTQSQSTHT